MAKIHTNYISTSHELNPLHQILSLMYPSYFLTYFTINLIIELRVKQVNTKGGKEACVNLQGFYMMGCFLHLL